MKPFVKWAGGKTQFLKIIQLLIPTFHEKFIEPFVGGGAVFLSLQPRQLIINDINNELITTYQVINKEQPQKLIKLLTEYEKKHNQEFYQQLKEEEPKNLTNFETAARFIYLNKTGYNGLYRVNGQGKFNVPWGQKEKVKLFDKENILTISKYLNATGCQVLNRDYQQILSLIKENDFLFIDPPYDSEKTILVNGLPVKQSGNGFNSYTADKFTQENQKELAQFLKKCEKQGAKWLLTNHATNFIKELYQDYWQFTFKARRFINCQGDKRMEGAKEIFIGNYQLTETQKKDLEFYQWFDSIQRTNISLEQLVNWENIQANLSTYEKDLNVLNSLICSDKKELEDKIKKIWQESPQSFQILPYLLAVRDGKNLVWLERDSDNQQNKVEYWDNLSLEKAKKLIFNSGLVEYLTSGTKSETAKIKDLKDYCLGIEVGLGTHGRKNIGGKVMEKAVENLLVKNEINYQKQVSVDFPVNGKKLFDFQIKVQGKDYYLETSFFNTSGSKVQEVIRSYSGVLVKTQKNEINFLWILDGKGLKSCKELLKETYQKNKDFMFTLSNFEKWLENSKK